MGSKISKKKQMFSLLNYKFANMWEESVSTGTESHPEKIENFSSTYPSHLLNKVYNFYKSIIQNLNSGLIAIDLNGEINFVNQSGVSMLGYEREELLGKNISEVFADDVESQKIKRAIFLPQKRFNDREVNFYHKEGTLKVVGLSSSQIHDENNNFDGIILLFRDLTEVRHLKIQLERMERLALLGELSAGIAHEIRNPLAGIRAAAQLLEESDGKADFQKQVVERIIREVDKANKLLKEFFKFAKPGKPNLKFHDIELLVDGVHLLLSPQMRQKNIEFITDFGDDIPQVYVDDTQMEQVFVNLFLNAIDAMKNSGKLSIKTYKKKMNILTSKKEQFEIDNNQLNYVFIEVSDSGCGISEQNIDKIFNPFFTTKPSGLGLGLSICSRLVSENGGNIDIDSVVGKGTTVTLALPAFVHP
ncbi:MAG: PAS domain S-box protein [Calditrichaeota bacterium]|nr:PAS domain S-box protein [Calditrichota bacterium]